MEADLSDAEVSSLLDELLSSVQAESALAGSNDRLEAPTDNPFLSAPKSRAPIARTLVGRPRSKAGR